MVGVEGWIANNKIKLPPVDPVAKAPTIKSHRYILYFPQYVRFLKKLRL